MAPAYVAWAELIQQILAPTLVEARGPLRKDKASKLRINFDDLQTQPGSNQAPQLALPLTFIRGGREVHQVGGRDKALQAIPRHQRAATIAADHRQFKHLPPLHGLTSTPPRVFNGHRFRRCHCAGDVKAPFAPRIHISGRRSRCSELPIA